MKKAVFLAAALLIGLGIASSSFAANSAYVNLQITVTENAGASILRTSADSVPMTLGRGVLNNITGAPVNFRNDGGVQADWLVGADMTNSNGWTLVPTVPVDNQVRVSAIFYYNGGAAPLAANFSSDDYITQLIPLNSPCNASAFADGNVVDPGAKGFDVPITSPTTNPNRDMWVSVDAPTNADGIAHTVAIVVFAIVG